MIVFKQQINYIADVSVIPNTTTQLNFYEDWKDLYNKWKRLNQLYPIRQTGQSYRDEIDWILINIIKPQLPKLLEDDLFQKVMKTMHGTKEFEKIKDTLTNWTYQNLGVGVGKKGKQIGNKDWEAGYELALKKVYPYFAGLIELSQQMSKQGIEDWEDLLIYAYNYPNEFRAWFNQIYQGYVPFPRRVRVKIEQPTQPVQPYTPPVQPYTPPPPFEPPKAPEPELPKEAGFDFGKILPILIGVGAIYFIIKR